MNDESEVDEKGWAYAERVDRLFTAYDQADLAIDRLQLDREGDDPGLIEHATSLLGLVLSRAATQLAVLHGPLVAGGPAPASVGVGAVERRLHQLGRRLSKQDASPTARNLAAFAWLTAAVGAGVAIALTWWWAAVGLLMVRIAGSVWIGRTDFPADAVTAASTPGSARARIERCLMSHAGDAAGLLGVTYALLGQDRSAWAMLTVGAVCLMLFGALARVGSLQAGVLPPRTAVERVARRGPLLVVLVATAVWQPEVPTSGVPLLGLACGGTLAYAVVELFRVHRMLGEGTGVIVVQRRVDESPILLHHSSPARPDRPADLAR